MFIINAIKKIKNSKRVLFTTPTHLQGDIIPPGLKNLIGYKAFKSDFSEVDGLDNLKHPENCIKQSQKWASGIYGTKQTFYLTNGSSSGILALMMSILSEHDKVLISRNSHESVINGLVLTGAIPVWIMPEHNSDFDILNGITLNQVKEIYNKNSDVKAIILTSPTYEGVVSEIELIAEFCKDKNLVFIVDEAHGALFPFSDRLPKSSLSFDIDACVQSLHKTTPALTGTALLHITKNSKIDINKVQGNLNLINSTSPSWLLIASIEGAVNYLNSQKGKHDIDDLINETENFKLNNKSVEFFNETNSDITKLVFKKNGFSGEQLSEFLFENNIEDELVTNKAVLALCGIGTCKKKLKKLSKVLCKLPKQNNIKQEEFFENMTIPVCKLSPKIAHFSEKKLIKKENCIGKIIGENITPYPPCIPTLIKGEVIEKKHLKLLNNFVWIIENN